MTGLGAAWVTVKSEKLRFRKTRLMISNPISETLFREIPGVKIFIFYSTWAFDALTRIRAYIRETTFSKTRSNDK